MGARILRRLQQRRQCRRFVLVGIAVDRLVLVRNSYAAKQLDPTASGAGCSRKYERQGNP
ncbi:hypothetical protein [Microvirga arabica]|uniref:Uncharacterized protein n=1 Tax=Microvirga arabica TaxID=1128671 RepID=A0ABV6YFN6_9HYPH|nr:hypothetical protein [Microvirga arabica]MBM1170897.1 hypothetical protein [Microvirga arabica]